MAQRVGKSNQFGKSHIKISESPWQTCIQERSLYVKTWVANTCLAHAKFNRTYSRITMAQIPMAQVFHHKSPCWAAHQLPPPGVQEGLVDHGWVHIGRARTARSRHLRRWCHRVAGTRKRRHAAVSIRGQADGSWGRLSWLVSLGFIGFIPNLTGDILQNLRGNLHRKTSVNTQTEMIMALQSPAILAAEKMPKFHNVAHPHMAGVKMRKNKMHFRFNKSETATNNC